MHDDNNLDRVIEAALATYAGADSGFEQRVLARIAAAQSTALRFRRMAWALVLAAAACLLLFILVDRPRPTHAPGESAHNATRVEQAPKTIARVGPPGTQRTRGLSHPAPRRNAAVGPVAAELPRQDVFPTPQPLSPTERVLVEFAAQAPKAERESFVDAQKQLDEPIHLAAIEIEAIQIPPLEPPSPGAN